MVHASVVIAIVVGALVLVIGCLSCCVVRCFYPQQKPGAEWTNSRTVRPLNHGSRSWLRFAPEEPPPPNYEKESNIVVNLGPKTVGV